MIGRQNAPRNAVRSVLPIGPVPDPPTGEQSVPPPSDLRIARWSEPRTAVVIVRWTVAWTEVEIAIRIVPTNVTSTGPSIVTDRSSVGRTGLLSVVPKVEIGP